MGPARVDIAIDRGTRIVRLLAWIMAFACAVLLFAILASSARAEDPKAAARAIGQAGAAAAGAIARAPAARRRCRAMPGRMCRSAG